MISQLPVIYGLLQGRIQLNFEEFYHRNHHHFFMYILNTLDLLRPLIFETEVSFIVAYSNSSYFIVENYLY